MAWKQVAPDVDPALAETQPTLGMTQETMTYKDFELILTDVGGQEAIRRQLWPKDFPERWQSIDALIFVVDSCDADRMDEAKKELFGALQVEQLYNVPVLVFANKQDLPCAMNKDEIKEKLCLKQLGENRFKVQPLCATRGDGLLEGLTWLMEAL